MGNKSSTCYDSGITPALCGCHLTPLGEVLEDTSGWVCAHCTFLNGVKDKHCDACGKERELVSISLREEEDEDEERASESGLDCPPPSMNPFDVEESSPAEKIENPSSSFSSDANLLTSTSTEGATDENDQGEQRTEQDAEALKKAQVGAGEKREVGGDEGAIVRRSEGSHGKNPFDDESSGDDEGYASEDGRERKKKAAGLGPCMLVEIHQSENFRTLYYRVGEIFPGGEEIAKAAHMVNYPQTEKVNRSAWKSVHLPPPTIVYGVLWGPSRKLGDGVQPSCAMNKSGLVVEVHKSEVRDKLFYSVGRLAIVGRNQQRAGGKGQSTGVIWGKPQSYDSGVHPSVACMGSGIVVEVHQSERRSKLFSKIGIVKPGEVKWRQAEVYDDGVMPAVAVTDLGMLIEVHQSENYQSVYYRYRHSIPFVTPSSLLSPSLTFLSISPTLLPLLASSTLLLLFFLPPSSCSSVSLWGYSTPSVMSWNGE